MKFVLLIVTFLFSFVTNVSAQETHSIMVYQYYNNEAVAGGEATLHRLGTLNGNNIELIDGKIITITDLSDNFLEYANSFSTSYLNPVESKQFNNEGVVKFEGVDKGLYMITQENSAVGFKLATPSLTLVNGKDEKILLKMSPDNSIEEPTVTTQQIPPKKGEIPYMGQDWSQVIRFSITGLILILFSHVIRIKKEDLV